MVSELFGGAQADHARDTLERMEAAKQIVEQRAIDRGRAYLIFQRTQRPTDQHEVFITLGVVIVEELMEEFTTVVGTWLDRESTRLNSSDGYISYAVFFLKE